ncbi:hypothetical protein ABPG74_009316 [Tetrahymena malaccensis]
MYKTLLELKKDKSVVMKDSSYKVMNMSKELEQLLLLYKQDSCTVDATNWMYYQGGIFQDRISQNMNQAANIIGYDTNYCLIRKTQVTKRGEADHIRVANDDYNQLIENKSKKTKNQYGQKVNRKTNSSSFIAQVLGKKLTTSKSLISKKSQLQRDFQQFKKTYGKSYESKEHESYRFNAFLENIKQADILNDENPSAEFGVTQFSDLTKDEFLSLYANAQLPSQADIFDSYVQNNSGTKETQVNLPQKWDIRVNGHGYLQKVKDQGACGSCWAFGITSTIENLYSFKKNLNINFSEQQLVDCTHSGINGCHGGWFTDGYEYAKSTGIAITSRYPYTATFGTCRDKQVGQLYKISTYKNLPNDSNSIKQALVTNGAISVAVDAGNWASYRSGIFSVRTTGQINKAATIIGYGPNYWLIRNTWGTGWGEAGHIRVANDGTGSIYLQYTFQPSL